MASELSWPELSAELSRKALTVISDSAHKHLVDGELSARELRLIVDAVYDTVSGLIDWDAANVIYAVRKDLEL